MNDDLDMGDLDISDILLVIARNVSESLEAVGINLKPGCFTDLFNEIAAFLQTPVDIGVEAGWSIGIAKITAKTKESPKVRSQSPYIAYAFNTWSAVRTSSRKIWEIILSFFLKTASS